MKRHFGTYWLAYLLFVAFCLCGSAILYPNFVSARVAAQIVICRSHIRHLSQAALMYADDNNNCLPEADKWMDQTSAYFDSKGNYRCPALPEGQFGYAYMDSLSKKNIATIENLTKTWMVVESSDSRWNAHGGKSLLPKRARHPSNNVGFADGHAGHIRPENEALH